MITSVVPSHPMAWAYCRVSDDKQVEKDNSLPEQQTRIEGYYRFKLAPDGVDWGGMEVDPAVSATKRLFEFRPAGKRLMEVMRPGDHLIVDKLDRLCRQVRDIIAIIDWLKKHKITLHIVNMLGQSIDMNTPMGEWMLKLFVFVAEAEAIQISERTIAHNKARRKAGRQIAKYPPIGCRHITRKVGKQKIVFLEWSPEDRAIMREIVRLAEVEKLEFSEISVHIEEHLAARNGRTFNRSAFYKRRWERDRCCNAYKIEKYYQDMNIQDVCDIPMNLTEVAQEHAREHGYMYPQRGYRRHWSPEKRT